MSNKRQDPFVLMGTHLRPGVHISGPYEIDRDVPFVTIGCDTTGKWWMAVADDGMELPAYIDLDEPDAATFLRTFMGLLMRPPAGAGAGEGRHRLSELREARGDMPFLTDEPEDAA